MSAFIAPMLAVSAEPFDSEEYLFEVKWNGVRALARGQGTRYQLWGRDLVDYQARYPELGILKRLPAGTVVDGELVLLAEGLPNLEALLRRHQLTRPMKIDLASKEHPATLVLFDLLYEQGRSLLSHPLRLRRELLQDLLRKLAEPRLVYSEGVVGAGKIFFEQAVRQGQEGIMAKHLASRYLPGRRFAAWKKIKPAHSATCLIIGWLPGRRGLRSLLVAAPWRGQMQFVANLQTGFTDQDRLRLPDLLKSYACSNPVVACPYRARWLKPELGCQVRFLEWTKAGKLRGASFDRLVENA